MPLGNVIRNELVVVGFSSNVAGAGFSPADATTYYWPAGLANGAYTVAGNFRQRMAVSGRIRTVTVAEIHTGTNGSSEAVTLQISVNGGTPVTLASPTFDQGSSTVQALGPYTGLDLAVVAGDYIDVNIVCPTWTTNPTGVYLVGQIAIEVA